VAGDRRRIFAFSGVLYPEPGGPPPATLTDFAVSLASSRGPVRRVCYIPTAVGDRPGAVAHYTAAFAGRAACPRSCASGEIRDAGLELRHLVAGSGSVKLLPGLPRLLDTPQGRRHVLSVLRLLEAEPSLLGLSQNFVAIAQAPAGD
jgi:hypothetical protein